MAMPFRNHVINSHYNKQTRLSGFFRIVVSHLNTPRNTRSKTLLFLFPGLNVNDL